MIAMQYSFVLPADYDMAIVRERIAVKGKLLDALPGLAFKAYLHAERGESAENLYAPFYLWHSADAMHDFLNGPGFAGVAQAFGWPSVRTWTPWHASVGDAVLRARHASRSVAAIAPYADLAQLRLQEERWAAGALERGALAVVVGFEPVTWSVVRLCLWRDAPDQAPQDGEQRYRVGHMSAPA
jgi:hypothetical protein